MKQVFKYISAKHFFADYAKSVKNFTHKMRGTDGNKNPIEFSPDDKLQIKAGLKNMLKDLINLAK